MPDSEKNALYERRRTKHPLHFPRQGFRKQTSHAKLMGQNFEFLFSEKVSRQTAPSDLTNGEKYYSFVCN